MTVFVSKVKHRRLAKKSVGYILVLVSPYTDLVICSGDTKDQAKGAPTWALFAFLHTALKHDTIQIYEKPGSRDLPDF
jgi:hypothetical protein